MTTKFDEDKREQAVGTMQDSSREVRQRWKQFQIILRGSKRHPKRISNRLNTKLQANLTKATLFVSAMSTIVTLLLAARIGLKIIAINSGTPFGRLVVDLTNLFLWPFSAMTETLSPPHISLLELSSLTAFVLYPFAAWVLIRFLNQLFPFQGR